MEFTARQIAAFLGGEVVGDLDVKINNVSKIEEGKPGTLTFLSNEKYNHFLYETKASVVLINKTLSPDREVEPTLIKVQDAYDSLARLMDLYVESIPVKKGIEVPSFISPKSSVGEGCYMGAFSYVDEGAVIGKNVQIYPHCWIGRDAVVEDNSILYSGVKVYPDSRIGKNCIIHAGAVIGSDGFGFAPQEDGTYKKLHQIGNVILEDDVEIGANTTIDCATMGSTVIKKGAKIDNLVQIAHNVIVGENTVMAGQVGIAGSTTIGKNCVFGGQSGTVGHIHIGDNVTVGGKTAVSNNIEDGKTMVGIWAMEAGHYRRVYSVYRNLPNLSKEIHQLKKEVQKLLAEK